MDINSLQSVDFQKLTIEKGYFAARTITKKFAKTFYFASLFLPKEKQYAAYSVYSVCRISDESVDNTSSTRLLENLNRIKERINSVYSGVKPNDSLMMAFKETTQKFQIPQQCFNDLIQGMQMDLEKIRYANFTEIYEYCYKVAGVVGLMMLSIFGNKEDKLKESAIALGVAMQLTNILRDIKEDFGRGRIYIPQDELKAYGISEKDIAQETINQNLINLLKFKINQARKYYSESDPGIKLISDKRCRFVILVMRDLYAGILDEIERNHYNIYSRRAHLTSLKKIFKTLRIIFHNQIRHNP